MQATGKQQRNYITYNNIYKYLCVKMKTTGCIAEYRISLYHWCHKAYFL